MLQELVNFFFDTEPKMLLIALLDTLKHHFYFTNAQLLDSENSAVKLFKKIIILKKSLYLFSCRLGLWNVQGCAYQNT